MKEIKQNSLHAWLLAARPKTLTGAVIPVLTGTSLALADGQFKGMAALLCLLFACGMQIAANFINDLYDYLKGTDREDRLGPERACAQGWITPEAHETGHRAHGLPVLPHRLRTAVCMPGTTAIPRLGTGLIGNVLRRICVSLYHCPLVSRLG